MSKIYKDTCKDTLEISELSGDGYVYIAARQEGRLTPGRTELEFSAADAAQIGIELLRASAGAQGSVLTHPEQVEAPKTNKEIINAAAESGTKISFTYKKEVGPDVTSHRVLIPGHDGVETSRQGYDFVVGHDLSADAPRAYRLDRIQGPVRRG